jgi:hypothetical protein
MAQRSKDSVLAVLLISAVNQEQLPNRLQH